MDSFIYFLTSKILNSPIKTENLSIIFPNQRAGVYFKQNFKAQSKSSNYVPKIFTFDSFVEYITHSKKTSKIELLFLLYKAYLNITPKNVIEPFEQFLNWGSTLLEDFNTLELYISPIEQVFEQLKDINIIHNWEPDTDLSKNYLLFLQNLSSLYHEFVELLKLNNKNFQGQIFRDAVEQITLFTEHTNEHFVFAGFNYFKRSEWYIVSELTNQNKASIYWDIPKKYDFLFDQYDFIKTYKREQWITGTHFENQKKSSSKIELIGANQNTSGIKFSASLMDGNNNDYSKKTIIPINQQSVPALMESIPSSVNSLNITMGLPLKSFGIHTLIRHFFQLHLSMEEQGGSYYFKNLLLILDHPLVAIFDLDVKQWKRSIIKKQKIYLSTQDVFELQKNIKSSFGVLFSNLNKKSIIDYLNVLNEFINQIKQKVSQTEKEVLFHFYKIHNQLIQWIKQYNPNISVKHFYSIYQQLVFSDHINFLGEPLHGLQIMGLLETQTLTFDHCILLETNEGFIPTNTKKPSYIPFDIRMQYGLPSYIDIQAEQAMIFAQILEHSKEVTIIYNTDNDTFGSNEMSRFVQHLIWKNPEITQYILSSDLNLTKVSPTQISKNESLQQSLKKWMQNGISPSALGAYTYNPLEFYKQYILKIKPEEDIQEAIEENILGTVVHNTLEELYTPFLNKVLTVEGLKNALNETNKTVNHHFKSNFESSHLYQGMNYLIVKIAKHFVKRFINDEIKSIEKGHQIKILQLEKSYNAKYLAESIPFEITFKGIIDRVDIYDNTLRIIDYKTGKVEPTQLFVKDFDQKITNYKYAKAIQVIIYTYLYLKNNIISENQNITSGILSFKNHDAGFMPLNFNNSRSPETALDLEKINDLMQRIELLIVELLDTKQNIVEKFI